jgi:hypothetical protein
MNTPRRFILQALDPDHGSPVLEALLLVDKIDDLRCLLGSPADDDPGLADGYDLKPTDLTAIADRFGVTFDPGDRKTLLRPWNSTREVPYLIIRVMNCRFSSKVKSPSPISAMPFRRTSTSTKIVSTVTWRNVFCTRRWNSSPSQNQPALRLAK